MEVIEQTTRERNEETKKLFEQIKPLLDEGYTYKKATCTVLNRKVVNSSASWYKELIQYGETQGYLRKNHTNRRWCRHESKWSRT